MKTLFELFPGELDANSAALNSVPSRASVSPSERFSESAEGVAQADLENAAQEPTGALTADDFPAWANRHGMSYEVRPIAVGDMHVVGDRIGLVLGPHGQSSAQLRELQAEWREKGVVLYYIYPWEKDTHKLFSHFASKLGLDYRKFAAKRLSLEEISNDEGNDFMKKHHIQGAAKGAGKVSLALKSRDGEVLAVQQFSRYRFGIKKGAGSIKESPVWEGLRLCFKPGVQIHGGASRLQKYFEKHYSPERIISYVSASHSTGAYKASQGFRDITDWNQMSYMWVLDGEPSEVPIIDKEGNRRLNDLDTCRRVRTINPSSMAGSFGRGVGQTLYGGQKLGSRKQLREHPENGDLVHNDVILEAIGYRRYFTAGQYKWEKNLLDK